MTNEANALGINGKEYHAGFRGVKKVSWDTAGLEITRLRVLSDPGYPFWDVSYCHGVLDGKNVEVILPFSQIPKKKPNAFLYNEAKKTGVYIKGLFTSFSSLS